MPIFRQSILIFYHKSMKKLYFLLKKCFLLKMSLSILISISIFSEIPISISISIFSRMSLSISISISIFSRVTLSISISISIFSKSVDISIIDMAYRYIEHPYLLVVSHAPKVGEKCNFTPSTGAVEIFYCTICQLKNYFAIAVLKRQPGARISISYAQRDTQPQQIYHMSNLGYEI